MIENANRRISRPVQHMITMLFFVIFYAFITSPSVILAEDRDSSQQKSNLDYSFDNKNPAWMPRTGPKLAIHRHVSPYVKRTAFEPFKILMSTDGFQVFYLDEPVNKANLAKIDILCIANAYSKQYDLYPVLTAPQAYSDEEIELLREWVKNGGALVIFADHSPFAGGTIKLAQAFGFSYTTGSALHKLSTLNHIRTDIDFRRDDLDAPKGAERGILGKHPITNGALGRAPVTHFFTFGGQAIIPPDSAQTLLTLPDDFETILTNDFFEQFLSAPRLDVSFLSQGSVMEYGKGRLAIFGEAGAFTSQTIANVGSLGFERPEADQNAEFALSLMRWLARFKK